MKRVICLLAAAVLLSGLVACVPDSLARLVKKPMNATLLDVLDAETKAYFEALDETPPLCMTVFYDLHYPEAIVFDDALIQKMCKALAEVRIASETKRSSTDGYHRLRFVTKEGKRFGFNFENSVLCVGDDRYTLENADPFWNLFKSTAEEYWMQAQKNAALYASNPVTYGDDKMKERVACTVKSVDAVKAADKGWLDTTVRLEITNTGKAPIAAVEARVRLLDPDGYEVGRFTLTADFAEAPLAPGELRECEKTCRVLDFAGSASLGGIMGALVNVERADNVPSDVRLGESLFDFYNDPDISDFAANFYQDLPALVTFRLNGESSMSKTFTDRDDIIAAFELLKPIVVTEKTDLYYADSGTIVAFSYDDGREYAFCFNMHNLERAIPTHPYSETYLIRGGDGLWERVDQLQE